MKKPGFTLIEVMVVVVIIAILATIAYPQFKGFRRRSELREIRNLVELTRSGAKYYDMKYGLDSVNTSGDVWDAFNVEIPADANAAYDITKTPNTSAFSGDVTLRVTTNGTWLYEYDLESEQGNRNTSNSDVKFIQDLPDDV